MSTTPPAAVPAPLRVPLGVVAALAAIAVAVLAIPLAGDDGASELDRWALDVVGRQQFVPWSPPWIIASIGDPMVAIGLTALLAGALLVLGRRRLALVAVSGLALTGATTTLLKPILGRTTDGYHFAYPSGHTAAATVLALVVAILIVDLLGLRRLPGLLLVLSGAAIGGTVMGWSQVSLGIHFVTDTIGGFGTALAVVPSIALMVDRVAVREARASVTR